MCVYIYIYVYVYIYICTYTYNTPYIYINICAMGWHLCCIPHVCTCRKKTCTCGRCDSLLLDRQPAVELLQVCLNNADDHAKHRFHLIRSTMLQDPCGDRNIPIARARLVVSMRPPQRHNECLANNCDHGHGDSHTHLASLVTPVCVEPLHACQGCLASRGSLAGASSQV